jgi:class 3 adenylate cyclase
MIPFNVSITIIWWSFIAILIALFFFFNYQREYHDNLSTYSTSNKNYTEVKQAVNVSKSSSAVSGVKDQTVNVPSGIDDREDLVKLFADTKKKLDTMGQDLAFLSIDIMDSTGMKEGEEKAVIEHDFKEYKKMVEDKINLNEAQKSAWTPDGVMICFQSLENAVKAGKDVIMALKDFNKNVKAMKQDFRIRCGINSGFVYCDESMPMAEMSDRVIDIAGHMQKYAEGNSIFMSRSAVFVLLDRSGFKAVDTEVDGHEAFVWKEE